MKWVENGKEDDGGSENSATIENHDLSIDSATSVTLNGQSPNTSTVRSQEDVVNKNGSSTNGNNGNETTDTEKTVVGTTTTTTTSFGFQRTTNGTTSSGGTGNGTTSSVADDSECKSSQSVNQSSPSKGTENQSQSSEQQSQTSLQQQQQQQQTSLPITSALPTHPLQQSDLIQAQFQLQQQQHQLQQHSNRWTAMGVDDGFGENEKWKISNYNQKMSMFQNGGGGGGAVTIPPAGMFMTPNNGAQPPSNPLTMPFYQPNIVSQQQSFNNSITATAKKYWGVDSKDNGSIGGAGSVGASGGSLVLSQIGQDKQLWRDTTWSNVAAENNDLQNGIHGTAGNRRVYSDTDSVASARNIDADSIGSKMINFLLGSSNTEVIADLEPRMRSMVLSSGDTNTTSATGAAAAVAAGATGELNDNKDKEVGGGVVTASAAAGTATLPKDENSNAQQLSNGIQCLDDDKCFNRTPGSRQPSPSDEELHKPMLNNAEHLTHIQQLNAMNQLQASHHHHHPHLNGPQIALVDNVVNFENFEQAHHLHHAHHPQLHHPGHHSQHQQQQHPQQQQQQQQQHNLLASQSLTPSSQYAGDVTQFLPPLTSLAQHLDSNAALMQQNQQAFDLQQLFRSHQQQGNVAPNLNVGQGPTAAQLQLIQQQQFLQQQSAAAAAFSQPQYLLNAGNPADSNQTAAAPYMSALIAAAGVPQYYGLPAPTPWSLYPTNLIQQSAAAAAAAAQTNGVNGGVNGAAAAAAAAAAAVGAGAAVTMPGSGAVGVGANGGSIGSGAGVTGAGNRRPLSPHSAAAAAAAAAAANGDVTNGGYSLVPYYPDQNTSILMAQNAALRNGAPLRLLSPSLLMQQQSNRQNTNLYSNNQNLYGNPVLNGGALNDISALGLNNLPSGRRDSFDRNNSPFSIDYRTKWNLGNNSNSLTDSLTSPLSIPPMQLSDIINSRINSNAATVGGNGTGAGNGVVGSNGTGGSEQRFRNSAAAAAAAALAANTMFGSSSSIFSKLNTSRSNISTSGSSPEKSDRSRILDEFRNNRYPNLQLRDIMNHVVEFSQDQHGSRFIQQKLERASISEKQLIFSEILPSAYNLMIDVFGNYVIQKFFEFGTNEQKTTLAQKIQGHVLPLALQMYGCRVIQKALESISSELQLEIVKELDGHVVRCVKDQNGNHVVQKCIECVEPKLLQFVINSFTGQVFNLSTHPYGCRVIQRILEHCMSEQTSQILKELHENTDQLIQDQFGNYVIQHVLEHGKPEDRAQLINSVRGKVLQLSQHKFASNVIEKCIAYSNRAERNLLIEEVCGFNENSLNVMMKDQYANYVVQKMIDVAEPTQRKVLLHKIKPYFSVLKKFTYGKHIIAKLEKYFIKTNTNTQPITTTNDLGPIGPPSVTNTI